MHGRFLSELLAAMPTLLDRQLQQSFLRPHLLLDPAPPATRPKWQMQAALHAFTQRGAASQSRGAASQPQCTPLIIPDVGPLSAAEKCHLLQSVL